MSPIRIASAGLSAEISPLGAELQSLRTEDGLDLMWDGNPAIWTGRAPILFPIVGKLANDTYRYAGRTYIMPKHGFARTSAFHVAAHDTSSATFTLSATAQTDQIFPFAFELAVSFALSGSSLTCSSAVTNHGTDDMPASFGYHPALRWPLPFGAPRDRHRIVFAGPEPAPIRRIDPAGMLLPEPEPTPVRGRELVLEDFLFERDAVIFDQLVSRSLHYGAPQEPQLRFDFPEMPILGVWTKPGADYICIEPWQGINDRADFAGDIFDKPGIVRIAPGETRVFEMSITLTEGGDNVR